MSAVVVRAERVEDLPLVRRINQEAFGQSQEADIVDALRLECPGLLSLVATRDGEPVGHILFSPADIVPEGGTEVAARGMGLAPMAVLPEFQGKGIGSALVREGLRFVGPSGAAFVIVLGHPGFYPRFGFEPASTRGIRCQWEGVPEEAFMILVLDSRAMSGVCGVARYRPEFDAAM